jgi:alpha-galactosidase
MNVRLSSVLLVLVVGPSIAFAEGNVKVFVLAGQSNMEGHGRVDAEPRANEGRGSLEWLAKSKEADEATAARFQRLLDESGKWKSRDDVQIWYLGRKGNLAPGFGFREGYIGPELGFGHRVGDALEEPVLLIKLAWGGKSLAKDFRPPSSEGEVGPYYRDLVKLTQEVLGEAKSLFPQYADRELQLAGFGWHQGWNDRVNQAFNDEYERNLANFIRDVRRDLAAPNLPFVIAETGMSGHEEKHPRALSLMKAQAAVAEYDEFRGNVAFVGTRDFYRPKEVSPTGQAYHWNSNAETYYLIGDAMGQAMLRLMSLEPAASQGAAAAFQKPLIVAHRGASGYRPEHTLAAYELAIEMGADFIEPDLVSTKDGVLICRHDCELGGTTDAASKFPQRRRRVTIDGVEQVGWFASDFTLAEIKTLRARERTDFRSQEFDGRFGIPTFQEALELVERESRRRGREIGVLPELKHPTWHDSAGLSLEVPLLRALEEAGLKGPDDACIVQCFETASLKQLAAATDVRLLQLLGGEDRRPADVQASRGTLTYGELMRPKQLREIRKYAWGIGPSKESILPRDARNRLLPVTPLLADAREAGLAVIVHTMRSERQYLAADYQTPTDEYNRWFRLGVDGLFTDFPDTAIDARRTFARED